MKKGAKKGGFERTVRRRLQCRLTPTTTGGDDGVGIFSVIGAKRREMRSGQGTKGGTEGGGGMFTPAAEARRDVGLLYAGKIENWLPYARNLTGFEMIPKSHHGRDSPKTLCWESLFTSGLYVYFLSLCYAFIQPVEFCSQM